MTAQSLPLAGHELFRTCDLEEARARVGAVFAPHGMRLAKGETRLDTRMNAVTFDRTGLFSLDYGAEVLITAAEWENCFLVTIPLAGAVEVSLGREQVVTTPALGSVLSPTEQMSIRLGAGNPELIVRFDTSALESHLAGMLGRELHRPLVFALGMDLTKPLSRSWLSVLDLLRHEAETDGYMLSQPLALKELEGLLMTQLLLTQPSDYTLALTGEKPRVTPPVVKRAMELIEARAAEPLTEADIAEAVGVSVRALRDGFLRHQDTTPMGFLRDLRLRRAHAELAVGASGVTSVAGVAYRWGFIHLGSFSLAYRERFGETPSETLRR